MIQVFSISKEDKDVISGSIPDDFIYSSQYNTLKYHASGTINVTTSGTTAEGTVSHGLGYSPFFTAYVNYFASPIGSTQFNMCPGTFNDFGFFIYANAYVDSSNIYFKVNTNVASQTFTFKYFIFRNNLGI